MKRFSSDKSKKVKPAMCLWTLDPSLQVNRRLTLNLQSQAFSFNPGNWGGGGGWGINQSLVPIRTQVTQFSNHCPTFFFFSFRWIVLIWEIHLKTKVKLAPQSGPATLIIQKVHKFNEFLNIKTPLCCHYHELLIYRAIKSRPSFIRTCAFAET